MTTVNFLANKNYDVSDLNGILGGLLSGGVIGSGCRVALRGSDKVCILSGMAVMPEGQLVTVDSDGVLLDTKKYVYLDVGVPCSSDTLPSGNVLLLAEVSDGVVTDKRVKAVSYVKGDEV